jgi:hypothetical protein
MDALATETTRVVEQAPFQALLDEKPIFLLLSAAVPRGYLRVLREFQILPRSSGRSAE